MKPLILAGLLALPNLASASLGLDTIRSEAALNGTHLVQLAVADPGAAPTPDCMEPTPVIAEVSDTTLYACAVFPDAE